MVKVASKLIFLFGLLFYLATSVQAATYFVKSSGNDSADGLSDKTAWRSIQKVVNYNKFNAGDDVYFRSGDTWKGTGLWVNWGGTADNYAKIGSYYVANGKEILGVSGNKPVIDGNNVVPTASHPSSNDYIGLIQVSDKDYLIIENLRVINSEGHGVKVEFSTHVNVENVDTYNTYRAGIIYSRCQDAYSTAKGNTVELAAMVWPEYSSIYGGTWPGALVAINSSHVTISKNKVFNTYGEGIGSYTISADDHASYNVIEDNLVYNNRAVQIYVANSHHNVVRRNIVYGTLDSRFYRSTGFVGPGLYVADETLTIPLSTDNEFYGNMVANCSVGISVGVNLTGAVFKNSVFYNNTVIDCEKLVAIYGGSFKNSYIRNNIFAFINRSGKTYQGTGTTSGLTWEYNLWPEEATGSRASSTNVYGIPALQRMTGWNSLSGGSVSSKDFALRANATNLINKARDLGNTYKMAVNCSGSDYPLTVTLIERKTGAWDFGADEFSSLAAPILSIK